MAKEVLELTVKSNIGEVTKETDNLGKSIGKASDETKDLDKGLEDAGKSGSKGFKAIGTAVKGFGMALKAAGIGLAIALFVSLKEALERNQTVMDSVSTIMTTVSTTFNQVVDTLIDVVSWVTASQDRFDGLTKVVTSLMTIALALYCTAIVSFFGTDWIAGFGIAIRLELLLIPIIFGIGGALIAIVGANVGAKKIERAINMTWKGTFFSIFIVGSIGILFSLYPNTWSSLFTEKLEIFEASKLYLNIVAPFYAFFALGLGLYFTSQAFNTLIWPVIGTLIRLIFVVLTSLMLFHLNLASPSNIFIIMSAGMIIYGIFISCSLHFGPWKKMINY